MKQVRTEDAVGMVLCHDITRIIKGEEKGPVFKKGHVIRPEDVPVLLSVGKENIYIWENDENMLHENDAALVLYDLCKNDNMHPSDISEGKVEAIADCDGLLKIDSKSLKAINALGQMMIASRHGNFVVKKGEKLAGMRVIPLVIEKEKMEAAKKAAPKGKILKLLPIEKKRAAVITTGSEVFKGRIEDKFTPVLVEKLNEYGSEMVWHKVVDDASENIVLAIEEALSAGVDLILVSGGMSVDPDDRTPFAIRQSVKKVISYGAPVLPGAMFMIGYTDKKIPIMGLPGCVMYAKRTIFDLILPRVLANDEITEEDINVLGEGGLCLNCDICTFPNCGFGKGK